MSISIHLDDDQSHKIEEMANRLNIPATDLAKAAIDDWIANSDSDFEKISRRILEKNQDLYRRLG